MAQGLLLGHGGQLLAAEGAERAARGGEYHFLDGVARFACQALEHGRMLGVDREDGGAVHPCQLVDEFSGHHQCLFVGQGNGLSGSDGVHRGAQSGIAHHGSEYHVDGCILYNLAEGVFTGIDLDGQVCQGFLQAGIVCFVGYHYGFRAELVCLFDELVHLVVGREHVGLIQVGMLLYHLQGLGTYGAGRAEYGYLFLHISFIQLVAKTLYIVPD